ncbi:MAG: PQQ-binding-like beta-propeller repeat protein [Thermoguttaceae bacterium]
MSPSWPRFHGPNGDNICHEIGLLKKWSDDGPQLLWKAKGIGEGYAGVSLAHGLIYTCGNLDEKTMITALDLDGNIKWQVPNGPAWTGDYPGTRGTPTIDGDWLYHESPLGEVICLDARTGQKLWGLNILKEFDAENITWALAESLLIDGQRVICCPGGNRASVAALDKLTGKTIWTARPTGDKAAYATPALAEYQGLRMILAMTQNALIGVNADSGDLLFRHEHRTSWDVNATTPIFHDGQIFITSGYGSGSEMLKLKVEGQEASVEVLWQSKELDNHHGGVLLLDGYLYGAAHNRNRGGWVCLEWKTGKKMYAERGVGKGSLTCANGMLYTLSENGDVGLVKATPTRHELISKFRLPKGGKGPTWAHPVVCGGTLYIRHGDLLYAYDVRGGE